MKTKLLFLATFFITVLFLKASAQTTQYEWEYVNTLQNEWLQKICTQGLDTVYIVGRNGLIAKSTDRALTWSKQYPVKTQLNDIIFCNHTTGFAVGDNGTILREGTLNQLLEDESNEKVVEFTAENGHFLDYIGSGSQPFLIHPGETTEKGFVTLKDFETELPEFMAFMKSNRIVLKHMECRRKTLDDLFVSLTGRKIDE